MDKAAPPITVVSLLGSTLDSGSSATRWQRWRPNVALCQHDDLQVDRLVLLRSQRHAAIADRVRADIEQVSPATRVDLVDFELEDPWDFERMFEALHEFARAFAWDTEREQYLVHITTGTHVAQICLFLLTESRQMPARLLQTGPGPGRAADPRGTYQIIDLDLSRYDRIAMRAAAEHVQATSFLKAGIATENQDFNRQIDELERVALLSTAPILLLGPTGAGKSGLARRIAELRRQRRQLGGPFVEVNCATLRGEQAMSALFGHERGAFTGAAKQRMGLLRSAHRGLLFLDEIGELGVDEQAMLLRALEDKRFLPVGADVEVESDFQLIAGTNRDLGELVAAGRFRDDLLARINLWTFRLPGLRERIEDLRPNLDFELEQFGRRHGRNVRFNSEARAAYEAFAVSREATWLGNFRDLNASITRLGTLANAGRITVDDVALEIARLRADWRRGAPDSTQAARESRLSRALGAERLAMIDRFDQAQLAEVLAVCEASASLSEAGRELFAVSRTQRASTNDADRLRKYLARFGLEFAAIARDLARTIAD